MMNMNRLYGYALLVALLAATTPAQLTAQVAIERTDNQLRVIRLADKQAASSIVTAIDQVLHANSDLAMSYDPSSNSIVCRGSEETLNQVSDLVEKLTELDFEQKASQETSSIRAYQLKYVDGRTAYQALENMLTQNQENMRIALDPRSNRIMVWGTEKNHERIASVLQVLDAPRAEAEQRMVLPLDATIANALGNAAADQSLEFDAIPQLDLAIVRGNATSLQAFRSFAENLQSAASKSQATEAAQNYLVRIVWLANGVEAMPVPKDLEAVQTRAEKFGISSLSMLGQLISTTSVHGNAGGEFQISGTIQDGRQIEAQGTLSLAANGQVAAAIAVESAGARGPQGGSRLLAEVSISLTPGQPAIIASAPDNGTQSIIVVEISKTE